VAKATPADAKPQATNSHLVADRSR